MRADGGDETVLSEYAVSKAIQGVAGAMGAASVMVFLTTKNTTDLIVRLGLGVYLAMMGVPKALIYLDMLGTTDYVILVGGIIGMGSWFAMGMIVEYLSKIRESGGIKQIIADVLGGGK